METLVRSLLCVILFSLSVNAIGAPAAGSKCSIGDTVCSSGPMTVVIDGMEVTRPCWTKTTGAACIEPGTTSTCDAVRDRGCKLSRTYCDQKIKIDGVEECVTETHEYECKVSEETSSTVTDCADQKFCIEGNCFDSGSPADPDFVKAVAGLEVAREAGVYLDEASFEVFKGQDNRCSKTVLRNCCKTGGKQLTGLTNFAIAGGSHYVYDVLNSGTMKTTLMLAFDPVAFALDMARLVVAQLAECDENEKLTAVRRDQRLCHFVGTYCAVSAKLLFIKLCLKQAETYCCFNSKISRMINQGARKQIPGLTWGTPSAPSCNGLSIEQFQSLDLAAIDFSEFYADIKPTMPDAEKIKEAAAAKVKSYFDGK